MTKRGQSDSINVDEIPAGWGIDGLLAQRFLGWTRGNPVLSKLVAAGAAPPKFWWHDPAGEVFPNPPKLSEDLNVTMQMVETLFGLGWKFGITQNTDKEVVAMFVPATEDYDPNRAVKARVVSVHLTALAICRAALLVAEVLHQDERVTLLDDDAPAM